MDGTVGIRDVEGDVNMSFGDILSDLDFSFMGAYRAQRDKFSVTVDGIYIALGQDVKGPRDQVKGEVDMDQTALEVDLGWDLGDRFTVFGGLRYVDITSDITLKGPNGTKLRGKGSESWIDPVIGAHYTYPFNDEWSATLRGDIGGFGVGSQFAWQGIAELRWQVKPNIGIVGAYRYIDMDYSTGTGPTYFLYDVAISGPALGVAFAF
jgi:opacity protein-like surface antigen